MRGSPLATKLWNHEPWVLQIAAFFSDNQVRSILIDKMVIEVTQSGTGRLE